ncbi:hypothetical protein [Ruegeria sp. HKCCA0235A]|uniref:hypothetical protein n=1 Tax=Ruegeria sp. HKCCA0235A TaxID=2682998 RepID=UPI00148790E5|nr:hypothetical protein [Ruegeria sp. HKCCA0235A]
MPQHIIPSEPWQDLEKPNRGLNRDQCHSSAPTGARDRAAAEHNGEADLFAGTWPTSFSKGLRHDENGIVDVQVYTEFLEEVADPTCTDNQGNRLTLFDTPAYSGPFRTAPSEGGEFRWRAWEGPILGHRLGFNGLDAGGLGIAPAPRLGSDELAAEMAELYAMACLRDVSFETIRDGAEGTDKVLGALGRLEWFRKDGFPKDASGAEIGKVPAARRVRDGEGLSSRTLFRGSSQGCSDGPYVSQFLLQGYDPLTSDAAHVQGRWLANTTAPRAMPFGSFRVDQRVAPQAVGVDYLRDWAEWLDVQNGADATGEQAFEACGPKFIETPRDLATYVHFDSIYQAFFNACLLMLGRGIQADDGLPEVWSSRAEDSGAHWGGSHALSMLAETATRAMRAVRRQTFQVHNRARPEKLGSVATLVANGHGAVLGAAEPFAAAHLEKLESAACEDFSLVEAIAAAPATKRFAHNAVSHKGLPQIDRNLLLPVAYPEGSPMQPSYGAAHGAVAGACATLLKAFFKTHALDGSRVTLAEAGMERVFVPAPGGMKLVESVRPEDSAAKLTLNGELNKLAANIAIGRNFAGVHFYSDYFDSIRMGERVAVGILAEQMANFRGAAKMSLETFDGDRLNIVGGRSCGSEIHIVNSTPELWWTRHLPEQAGWAG